MQLGGLRVPASHGASLRPCDDPASGPYQAWLPVLRAGCQDIPRRIVSSASWAGVPWGYDLAMRWTKVPAAAWPTPHELVQEGLRHHRVVMLNQTHDELTRWLWVLVAVSLALAVAIPLWLWPPRAPSATADHETWKLFGRPPAPGDWISGDGAYPVPLQGGRVAWLFGDSQVRRADATNAIVHNTIVIQDGDRLRTLAGGTPAQPTDLIPPVQPGTWLWPSSGFVEQGRLMVFAEELTRPASDGDGFQATHRRYLVSFQLPDLAQGTPQAVYDGPVAWGHTVLVNADQVYVYGNLERDGWTNLTYLARFRLGHSGGYWQFWNGHRFSSARLAAAPLRGPDGRALVAKLASVIPIPAAAHAGPGARFAALSIDPFATTIDLRVAAGPQGPWRARHPLCAVPELHAYLPHARTDQGGAIRLAYSVANSQPRYLSVNW